MRVSKFYTFITIYLLLLFPISIFTQIEEINFDPPVVPTINKIEKVADPVPLERKIVEDLIHTGDLVDIDILGSTEFDFRGEITPEGFLTGLKFVDTVFVQCKTEEEISHEVAKLYSKFLKNPKVVVKLLDKSKRPNIILLGEIKVAQKFQKKRNVRLNELLILSGGLTEEADGEIQILRQKNNNCQDEEINKENFELAPKETFIKIKQNDGLEILTIKIQDLLNGNKEANPEIIYGDLITVKGSNPLFVIGGVNRPGKILFREDLTVSRAIATAGGLSKEDNTGEVRILRREENITKTLNVNLFEIKSGKTEDLLLKPYDVVDVIGKDTKRIYSPVIEGKDPNKGINSNLPLRVID